MKKGHKIAPEIKTAILQRIKEQGRTVAQAVAQYREVPVLAADEAARLGRRRLILAAQKVLGETLDLLGLSQPEVM